MIIESLLDTDLYKLTMQQAVFHRFADARAEYEFHCRDEGVDLRPAAERVRREVRALGELRFAPDEIEYLATLDFFAADYLDYLAGLRLDPAQVCIEADDEFRLSVAGPWLETILFEVPLLAIVNESYFSAGSGEVPADADVPNALYAEGERRLDAKIALLRGAPSLRIAEFGTRRRYSRAWHDRLLKKIRAGADWIGGTSNVFFARKYGLRPVGTMAHEYLQACQAFAPLREFQRFALRQWLDEFGGRLGIALSDVVGIDAFLNDFDGELARAYEGLRHDSGDPFEWGEKVLAHYRKLGVDPAGKTLVFSDGLDIPTALEIQAAFGERARVLFGIGTNLTNDLGPHPLNIVIKMTRCNGAPVAKISDSPGKGMCPDREYLARLKETFARG